AWLHLRVARNGGGAADTPILSAVPNSAPELVWLRRRISPCIGFCARHFARGFLSTAPGRLSTTRTKRGCAAAGRARLLAGNSFTMRCLFVAVLIGFVLVVYASAIELFSVQSHHARRPKFQYNFDVSDPASQSAGDA